jgi:hypothetical protein
MTSRRSSLILLACFAGIFTSCTTYQADFAQAVGAAEVPPHSPQGPWEGHWKSNANGHEGPLWCILSPTPDNPKAMDFRYRAGWGKIQFGDYLHTVAVPTAKPQKISLADQMKLPGGFGTYTIKGTVTSTTFDATFRSDGGDHGTMTLRRPK